MLRHKSPRPLSHQHHNGLALALVVERSLDQDGSAANVARLAAKVSERFEVEQRSGLAPGLDRGRFGSAWSHQRDEFLCIHYFSLPCPAST